MRKARRRRRILWLLLILVAGGALIWLALPLWFPWVLRPLAQTQGASFGRYERQGYHRFAVNNVTFTNPATILRADRIEALVPTTWLWRVAVSRTPGEEVFARATNLSFHPIPTGKKSSTSAEARKVENTLRALKRWLPSGVVSQGAIHLGETTIGVPFASWSNGVLNGTVRLPAGIGPVTVQAWDAPRGGYVVNLSSQSLDQGRGETRPYLWEKMAVEAVNTSTGLVGRATASWWTNPIALQVHFAEEGYLPKTALLQMPQARLPGELLPLGTYEEIQGSLFAKWESGSFALDVSARAETPPTQTNLPPLRLELHARGDTNAAVVQTARLVSSAFTAELSRELTVHFQGPILREPARLTLNADLSKQDWIPLEGKLTGWAELAPGPDRYPRADFHVAGEQLSYRELRTREVAVDGRFDYPHVDFSRTHVVFADGSRASLSGGYELERRAVTNGQLSFAGPLLRQWLPDGYGYESLSLTGQVAGAFQKLVHSGRLEATEVTVPSLNPMRVGANWKGTTTTVDDAEITAATTGGSVFLRGGFILETNGWTARLADFLLRTNDQDCLRLGPPVHVTATQAGPGEPPRLALSPLDLEGPGGRISAEAQIAWPEHGRGELKVEKVSAAMLTNLVSARLPTLEVLELTSAASWSNGPVIFHLAGSARGEIEGWTNSVSRLDIDVSAAGNSKGLVISNLVVNTGTSAVAQIEGNLPVTFNPQLSPTFVGINTNEPLRLAARSHPQSRFWDELSRYTRVKLRDPQLEANVSGTWSAPAGKVQFRAANLQWEAPRPVPNLERLEFVLELDGREARLTTGRLLVQGQPVLLAAQVPLGQQFWNMLRQGKHPDWQQASARVLIEDADLAAFQSFAPEFLVPQGNLILDLSLLPGGRLAGQVDISRARTQPLGSLGPIRDIGVVADAEERKVFLRRATANIGGATVAMTGRADLTGTDWLKGSLPPFTVSLHGNRVPLARQPEFILRSDLLLSVTKTNGAPPLVSGSAQLRDSYFLSDLRDLVPRKVATTEKRPPYFSITEPFLADWRLAVDVAGTRFLKVRSPLFNGLVSANLKLQGTLKDPIALGDARIDSGVVRFPFASLQVQQGIVSLTSQNPYHPQLSVRAGSRQFGYEIRMEATGPVDAPIIQFNSTPPLTSEQILLMVTAGELPRGSFNLTSQQRAQTVALFFGRDLLSTFGLWDESQPRLSIRSGEQITEQGRPTYNVEYKLTDRWSITGEYDRFGDYNAGVKWRVYSK